MYVSSFNTYINSDSIRRTQKNTTEENTKNTKNENIFESKLLSKTVKNVDTSPKFPINYISNYKALNNQQKLQEKPQYNERTKFLKLEAQFEAKNAYSNNFKIFSPIVAPHMTREQTLKIDKELPQSIQNIKEKNLRKTMLNTYISNENYYRITA